MRYEGYGPGGVAVIVEALTDNRNRAASDIRSYFTKSGGNLGESNSVSFLFDHLGQIDYPAGAASADALFEAAAEAGADDVDSGGDEQIVSCAPESLNAVRDKLEAKFGPARSARLARRSVNSRCTLVELCRIFPKLFCPGRRSLSRRPF